MATAGTTRINIDLALNTRGFRPLGRINGQLGEFEKSLDASNARVLAFGASAGAILAVKKAFTATVKAALEVEKSLKDINVILQVSTGNLQKFGSQLFKIASDTGQAFNVAAEAATELARQGLGVEETLKRTKDALILARLSGLDAAEAVNALTAALNTFTRVGLDSTTIINKLANVDAAFAVSSEDLAKALGRVGSSAVSAGVDLDQLLAIVTTAQQKTARGGAVIGNSFKTIFTRIQRPRVIKELENLGVQVRNIEGDTLPAIRVLENLAKTFDNLSSSQRAQISELVGGVFQVNVLKAALSDLSREQGIYNRALGISIGSSDQAIRRNEELNETLAAQFQKTLNTFKEAAAELGTLTLAPALENIFGAVNKTFAAAAGDGDLAKAGQFIGKTVFESIGKFIGGPGLLIIGATLFKTFANLATFATDAFRTLTGLNKNFQNQLNLQKQIFGVLSENPDLMNRIRSGTLSVEDAHQLVLDRINEETTALDRQLIVSQQIAAALSGSGVGFSPDFGATTGGTRKFGRNPRGRSGGFVPNFADDELMGMMMGGYSNSQLANPKIRKSLIHNGRGGAFTASTNGHEDIVDFRNSKGKKSTAVIPPRGSGAFDDFVKALSGGYVPNFFKIGQAKGTPFAQASAVIKAGVGQRYGKTTITQADVNAANKYLKDNPDSAQAKAKKGRTTKKIGNVFDVGQQYGGLALFGVTDKKTTIRTPIKDITPFKHAKKPLDGSVYFKNFQQRSFLGETKKNNNEFSGLVKKHMAKPMEKITNDFAQAMGLRDDAPKITSTSISKTGGPLFPPGAEGSIFETAINAMTKNAASFESGLSGDTSALWDFEESGQVDKKFKKKFGYSSYLKKADAKRTLDQGAFDSIGNKIVSSLLNKDTGKVKRSNNPLAQQLAEFAGTAAGGFVPSFSALHSAVQRERSAGIPMNKIRVGSHKSLASGLNPMGLGVYNTRDEPSGLGQGVRRSLSRGLDPRKSGIPNFANGADRSTNALFKLTTAFFAVQTGLTGLKNALSDNEKSNYAAVSSINALEKGLVTFIGALTASQLLGEKGTAFMTKTRGNPNFDLARSTRNATVGALGFASSPIEKTKEALAARRRRRELDPTAPGRVEMRRGTGGRALDLIGQDDPNVKGYTRRRNASFFRNASVEKIGADGSVRKRSIRGSSGFSQARKKFGKSPGLGIGVAGGILAAGEVGAELLNNTFNSSAQELDAASKNFERVNESAERNIGALNKFSEAAEQASKVYHDSNASIGQVLRAQRDMTKALSQVPAEVRSRLSGAFDSDEIQAAVQAGIELEQQKKQQAQSRLDVAQTTRDIRKTDMLSPTDVVGMIEAATFSEAKGARQRGRDLRQATGAVQGAMSNISDEQLAGLTTQQIAGISEALSKDIDIENMSDADISQRMTEISESLRSAGFDESAIDSFTKGMEEGGYAAGVLTEALREEIQERAKLAKQEEALRPVREALLKQERAMTKAAADARQQLEFEQSVRKEVIKINQKAADSFLTATQKIESDANVALAFQQEKANTQFGSAVSAGEKAFGKSRLTQGLSGDALTSAQGLQAEVGNILASAAVGGIGSVSSDNVEGIIQKLQEEAKTASGERKNGIENMIKQLDNLNTTSTRLEKEQKQQTERSKELVAAQKAAARQAMRLRAGGGVGAIGNPAAMDDIISRLRGSSIAGGIAARTGSASGMDSAVVNRAKAVQDLVGGDLAEINPALAKKARGAAFRDRMRSLQGVNRTLAPGERMSQDFMRKAAEEQASALFKGSPIEEQTKATRELTSELKKFRDEGVAGQIRVGAKEREAADYGQQSREFYERNKRNFTRNVDKAFNLIDQQDTGYDQLAQARADARETGGSDEAFFGYDLQTQEKADARSSISQSKEKLSKHTSYVDNSQFHVYGMNMKDTKVGKDVQESLSKLGMHLSDKSWRQATARGNNK